MEQTFIIYEAGSSIGVPSGSWTIPAHGNQSTARYVRSIGYPILAASVCADLETNVFQIDVPDATGLETVTLRKALPDTPSLLSLVNSGIKEAFASFTGSLPQLVQRASGWVWTNPTSTAVDITFPSSNMQQLLLGSQFTPSIYTLNIPAGSESQAFFPDSRLGAVSQSLSFSPGQSYRIELPLSGEYREGILYRPQNERVFLNSSINSARVTVSYPSIGSNLDVSVSVRSEIVIISDARGF